MGGTCSGAAKIVGSSRVNASQLPLCTQCYTTHKDSKRKKCNGVWRLNTGTYIQCENWVCLNIVKKKRLCSHRGSYRSCQKTPLCDLCETAILDFAAYGNIQTSPDVPAGALFCSVQCRGCFDSKLAQNRRSKQRRVFLIRKGEGHLFTSSRNIDYENKRSQINRY